MRRSTAGGRARVAGVFLVGLLAGVVLGTMALEAARAARSQAPLPEGAFVQGQDETRWVVGGSRRFRMAFVSDDAGQLPALAEGDPVATVCEAAAAIAGTDPEACGPRTVTRPPVAVPTPAAPAVSGLLFEARGGHSNYGQIATETFTLDAPAVLEFCWEMSGPVPEVGINPWLDITVWDRQTDGPVLNAATQRRAPGCWPPPEAASLGRLPAGTYYLKVTSFYRDWHVTVRTRSGVAQQDLTERSDR